jgi:hypothetical protein
VAATLRTSSARQRPRVTALRGKGILWKAILIALPVGITAAILRPEIRETLAAVLVFVVGAATVAYALLTERLVGATDKMRVAQEELTRLTAEVLEAQTRPNVIVHTELHGFLVYLVVENMGAGEAFDVHLDREGPLEAFPDQLVANAAFWTEGFRFLAPGQRHAALFFNTTRAFPENPQVRVTVQYRSRAGARYEADFQFNAAEMKNLSMQYAVADRLLKALQDLRADLSAFRFR